MLKVVNCWQAVASRQRDNEIAIHGGRAAGLGVCRPTNHLLRRSVHLIAAGAHKEVASAPKGSYMGLGRHAVEAILREHQFRPIRNDVVIIGRQTVYFGVDELVQLLTEFGIDPHDVNFSDIELDHETVDRLPGFRECSLVSDKGLFRLLGCGSVRALDHSAYEGAEIIHDLRHLLPRQLHGIADFIVDGSTLDNIFTPETTLRNYCDLLRPGGRLIAINAFSTHDTPYVIMPPLWYVDYFVVNRFVDCKVYVIIYIDGRDNVFYVDLDFLQRARREMGRFRSPHHMVTLVFAEKGQNSTTHLLPNQQDYRSSEEWEVFCRNLSGIQKSQRPHLVRSHCTQIVVDVIGGHRFVDNDFVAH
jgi:hypothetical protein